MSSRDRKKSPEEMAALMAQLKRDKEKKKRQDAIKNVRNGMFILFVCALLCGGLAWLVWSQTYNTSATGMIGGCSGAFILLGIFYKKDPMVVPVIGLCLYCFIALLTLSVLTFFIHFMVIFGLASCIKYGNDYKAAVKYQETDPLDQGVFEDK